MLAQDASAIAPAVQKAVDEGIPVIGYDRLIENPNAFYITFDNKEVGRMQARAVFAVKADRAIMPSSRDRPPIRTPTSCSPARSRSLKDAIDAGRIKNVGEAYTDGWLPANAQKNMEQILTKNGNRIDAVVASNDGTAGGAIAALAAQGMAGAVPVSGQDGDHAALNRVALGTQTVSVWKDARVLGNKAGRDRGPAGRRQTDERDCGRGEVRRRPEESRNELAVPDTGPDHARTISTSSSMPAGSARTRSARA